MTYDEAKDKAQFFEKMPGIFGATSYLQQFQFIILDARLSKSITSLLSSQIQYHGTDA